MRRVPTLMLFASVVLAGVGGFLAANAVGQAGQPTQTVTVDVGTGAQGPPGPPGERGPAGPPGPAGSTSCPDNYTLSDVLINHKGGHLTILACVKT